MRGNLEASETQTEYTRATIHTPQLLLSSKRIMESCDSGVVVVVVVVLDCSLRPDGLWLALRRLCCYVKALLSLYFVMKALHAGPNVNRFI